VLVDDVLTTGETKHEAVEFLRRVSPRARFPALLVVLDRQETAPDGTDAVRGFTEATGVPVLPALRVTEVIDDLARRGTLAAPDLARCRAYWSEHGTDEARAWARGSASTPAARGS
jgi:orotate phosphoribosyltransferase